MARLRGDSQGVSPALSLMRKRYRFSSRFRVPWRRDFVPSRPTLVFVLTGEELLPELRDFGDYRRSLVRDEAPDCMMAISSGSTYKSRSVLQQGGPDGLFGQAVLSRLGPLSIAANGVDLPHPSLGLGAAPGRHLVGTC